MVEGLYTHHNASAQVFSDGERRTRFVWIADLLPHDLVGRIDELMEQGTSIIRKTMEAEAARAEGCYG